MLRPLLSVRRTVKLQLPGYRAERDAADGLRGVAVGSVGRREVARHVQPFATLGEEGAPRHMWLSIVTPPRMSCAPSPYAHELAEAGDDVRIEIGRTAWVR